VAGFINGHDPAGTLALANAVGAATATGRGAGTNVADVATVQRLLAEAAAGGAHDAGAVASAGQLLRATLAGAGSAAAAGAARRPGPAEEREPAARAA
jgi:hypothetical protein